MAKTLDDIFDDDEFGLLNSKEKTSYSKTDEDRLIDSFEEINTFFEKNQREPSSKSMSEYNLLARLKSFRNDDKKKKVLKPFDCFNLLGHVEMEKVTLNEVLLDDEKGLLDTDNDTSIFTFKHTPKKENRQQADFVAQRQAMPEKEFSKYDFMFQQVHKELKEGKRKLLEFYNIEKNLQINNYYIVDGVMLYLESAELETELKNLSSGGRIRKDGRTVTIFENATKSNMTYRSLGKAIQKSGRLITQPEDLVQYISPENTSNISEEDLQSGWIYVLKSKSKNPDISAIKDLYKIGFSSNKVEDRIKNAAHEATYLFADVDIVATYLCYNLNMQLFENLIHRFFGESCLSIDLYSKENFRNTPREWFVVPVTIIDEAIHLLMKETIIEYRYDRERQEIVLK